MKNFNQWQYGLIHIVHLVNFDKSLSTLHIVQSMLNFVMFLVNSNQEKTIQTMQVDPYCPHKVFIMFHQRLMLFSISNAFKKQNRRQQNLTHIALNIYNDCFLICVAFSNVCNKFWSRTYSTVWPMLCFNGSIRKYFFICFKHS